MTNSPTRPPKPADHRDRAQDSKSRGETSMSHEQRQRAGSTTPERCLSAQDLIRMARHARAGARH